MSIVSSLVWRFVGSISSFEWPSSVSMASSQTATLMKSRLASSCFSWLIYRVIRSVIISAPSCFGAFMRLLNAPWLPFVRHFVEDHLVDVFRYLCIYCVVS